MSEELAGETPEYRAFVEKFKRKKTTDDCYTPENVYEVVAGYVARRYGVDCGRMVRPFWPDGDYERFEYAPAAVVVDNPPFSILSRIQGFYLDKGIPFFLFAPSLTAISSAKACMRTNHIITNASIQYANGAIVRTSFVTNMGDDGNVMESEPELSRLINEADALNRKAQTVSLPKYEYPDEVATAARFQYYAAHGARVEIKREHARRITALDSQRAAGKTVFGGGLLLKGPAAAERAAAERVAAERAAAERAAAERAAALRWSLSEEERAWCYG